MPLLSATVLSTLACTSPAALDDSVAKTANQAATTLVDISKNVHVVDPSALVDVGDGQLVFHAPSSDILSVQTGDLLVSSGGQGFLRGVLSVDGEGDTITFATRQASLEEAIVNGEARASQATVSSGAASLARTPAELSDDGTVSLPPFNFTFVPITLDPGEPATLNVNGSVTLQPSISLDLVIENGNITKFRTVLLGDLTMSADLQLVAGAALNVSKSVTLAQSPPIILTEWIGAVPVVETVTLSLVASAGAGIGESATLDLGGGSLQTQLSGGAEYSNGSWLPIFSESSTFDPIQPGNWNTTVGANAQLNLTLRAQVLLYGVSGPFVEVGPYASASVTPTGFNARVGVKGSFGGELQLFGQTVGSYSVPLFDDNQSF